MFVDQVRVKLQAGKGGNGCVSFRREWGVPKGGPDGGRGGNGGSVYLVSEPGLTTLSYFRFHPINRARNGAHGEGNRRSGKTGEDIVLRVPVGTVVKSAAAGETLFDFVRSGQKYEAARGGKGGRGNATYATPTHRTPREHQPGAPGEDKDLILELKLIADVGLVGFPNVGKSTLISKISSAHPVIADYPFTTLIPHLGVVDASSERSFVVADIPGLIEGAHEGHGLGIQFLKHIERTKILVHIVDVSPYSGRDPVSDFRVVLEELKAYSPSLANRPQILLANKVDLLGDVKKSLTALRRLAARRKLPFLTISALKGSGLKELVSAMAALLQEQEAARG
ncbi:MAG: GTPase ObgE [Candidatus Aminicenantes bacterium RBG_16_63_16]|nr:MAG: GTPase ObgE [Candidatus Aminicenantes bacterium RBG_16_63_16]